MNLLLAFTIAFVVVMGVMVYLFRLPHFITQQPNIVNEYYYTNAMTNIPLDFVFIALYFLVAYGVIRALQIETNAGKVLVVALTTIFLTLLFWWYFTSSKVTSNFFSRWFHTVGLSSVVYDVVLLVVMYIVFMQLLNLN